MQEHVRTDSPWDLQEQFTARYEQTRAKKEKWWRTADGKTESRLLSTPNHAFVPGPLRPGGHSQRSGPLPSPMKPTPWPTTRAAATRSHLEGWGSPADPTSAAQCRLLRETHCPRLGTGNSSPTARTLPDPPKRCCLLGAAVRNFCSRQQTPSQEHKVGEANTDTAVRSGRDRFFGQQASKRPSGQRGRCHKRTPQAQSRAAPVPGPEHPPPQAAWGKTTISQHKTSHLLFSASSFQEFPSLLDPRHLSRSQSHQASLHLLPTRSQPSLPQPSATSAACGLPAMATCRQGGFCPTPSTPQAARPGPARPGARRRQQTTAHSLSSGLGEARMALCFLFTSSTFSEILSMNPRISSTCRDQADRSPVRGLAFWKGEGLLNPTPKHPGHGWSTANVLLGDCGPAGSPNCRTPEKPELPHHSSQLCSHSGVTQTPRPASSARHWGTSGFI